MQNPQLSIFEGQRETDENLRTHSWGKKKSRLR